MERLVVLIVCFITGCAGISSDLTLVEAESRPSFGHVTLISSESPLNQVDLVYYNSDAKRNVIKLDFPSTSKLSIPLLRVEGYDLYSVYLYTETDAVFLKVSQQCKSVNGLPMYLQLQGAGYDIPNLIVPHLSDNKFCFSIHSFPGHTY